MKMESWRLRTDKTVLEWMGIMNGFVCLKIHPFHRSNYYVQSVKCVSLGTWGCVASKSVPLLTLDSLQPYLPPSVT